MRGMNRQQRREIQNMSKKQLLEKLPGYYCQCYDEGVKDSFMALLLKLHDEFDFGNEEILKLAELNKKVYMLNSFDLSLDQKLEFIELIEDNEIAKNRLKEIINNDLENEFDFDSLMDYLKKQEKKNSLNI